MRKVLCFSCKEAKTTQLCVGCEHPHFICTDCALPCAWCGDKGPYCEKCITCVNETDNNCGEPGNHNCWECERRIPYGSGYFCVDEDPGGHDGRYCQECIKTCNCNQYPTHFICPREDHDCDGPWNDDVRCDRSLCLRHSVFKNIQLCNIGVCCDDHIPEFTERVENIIYERKKRKLEEKKERLEI